MIAAAALQAALLTRLSGDAALTGLLGGAAIHDRPPVGTAFPYVTFGPAATFDWSTGTEPGDEHLVTLHVWTRQAGKKQALDIAAAIRAAIEGAPLALAGHTLTLIRFAGLDAAHDNAARGCRATLKFEALTEPATA